MRRLAAARACLGKNASLVRWKSGNGAETAIPMRARIARASQNGAREHAATIWIHAERLFRPDKSSFAKQHIAAALLGDLSEFLGVPVPECTRRLVFRSSGTEGPTTPAWLVCPQAPGLENLNFNRSPRPDGLRNRRKRTAVRGIARFSNAPTIERYYSEKSEREGNNRRS